MAIFAIFEIMAILLLANTIIDITLLNYTYNVDWDIIK
jgi:hypothetical protein